MKIEKEIPPHVCLQNCMEVDLENFQSYNYPWYSESVLVQFSLQKCIIAYVSLMYGVNGIFCNMD
jgi:hypothetical protein